MNLAGKPTCGERRRRLETHSRRKLHHARAGSACELAEEAVGLVAVDVDPGGGVHARELRVVEGVVGLDAKLEGHLLLDRNVLEERQVPVVGA